MTAPLEKQLGQRVDLFPLGCQDKKGKPLGRPLVDTFITEVSQDTWIYFPWDIELQFKQPIVKMEKSES